MGFFPSPNPTSREIPQVRQELACEQALSPIWVCEVNLARPRERGAEERKCQVSTLHSPK